MADPRVESDVTVKVNTGQTIDGGAAIVTDIYYRKPNSNVEVNLGGSPSDTTYIEAQLSAATNDTPGKWKFYYYILFATGEEVNGPAFFINIREKWHPWDD